MITDNNLLSTLRIVHRAKANFAIKDSPVFDDLSVECLKEIPHDDAFYYVGGETIGSEGTSIESVFYIDSRGELHSTFWLIHDHWYSQMDGEVFNELGVEPEAFFPYEHRLAIPIAYSPQG